MKKTKSKKLYATRTVKLCCFFLAVLLTVGILQDFVLRRLDQNSIRLQGFYLEDQDTLDVVFLGASEVYTGIAAGRAYDKYGFTSYPFASESITADGTMLALKEILRTQNPQMIMIEINPYLYGFDTNESHEAHIRKLVDNIPLNMNKIEYISNNVPVDEQREYYMPIIKYHGLWTDVIKNGRRIVSKIKQDLRGTSYLKGFRTTTTIFTPDSAILNDKLAAENGTLELHPTLEKKFRDLLQFCRDKDLNVVFMRTPHMVYKSTYNRVKRANRAGEIIAEYGFDYINIERDFDKTGIDLKTDFYNYDHMNIYGTVKLTDYVCDILVNKYGIEGKTLSSKDKAEWEKAAKCFRQLYKYCDYLIQEKHEKIQLEEDINTLSAISKY